MPAVTVDPIGKIATRKTSVSAGTCTWNRADRVGPIAMLIHLARISVITIALALVGGLGILLARANSAPTVITVVVPAQQAAQTTIVQPAYVHPYYRYYCGRGICWD